MAILGTILKRTIKLRKNLPRIRRKNAYALQERTLRRLISKAEFTAFGEHYQFSSLLGEKDIVQAFQKQVDVHDYNSMFRKWWYRSLNGESYVCWPEEVKYFALSSGTSESSSKHIPVTKEMIKTIRRTSAKQLFSLAQYDVDENFFGKGMLMIGGSTHLNFNGTYFEGDLSGITTGNLPFWFQHFYKPGTRISKERDWNSKLDEMTRNAKSWDIGVVAGVPAWVQILFERIIDYYQVKTIHDIWPNLAIYVHGGVSFLPYKNGFEKLLGKPISYLETYLASEGFIAFQARPNAAGMKLALDTGIFFEFVPFTSDNFSSDGDLNKYPQALSLNDVQEGVEYALLLSTCSGAWRYLIGDTIRFTDVEHCEIAITGRTKQFLSLCGEHLSQDNMNRAIRMTAEEMEIDIKEFAVAGIHYESLFAHKWYIGTDNPVDADVLKKKLDDNLKALNDDYRVERIAALKEIFVEIHSPQRFYDWMKQKGKEGGQNKFPRVLKGERLEEWTKFLADYKSDNV
ncbi:MAG TPA: GH3 auxin-responsive promoter family protein [Bacteroidia bacterium]|jgi:hypothetical protein|nr:GH3 auxin-responsive promoter family protein [Bacteroidia bacterium]